MSDRPETTNPPIKKQIDMAKESMKAREVKRAKLVAKYAAKKAALKEAPEVCTAPHGSKEHVQLHVLAEQMPAAQGANPCLCGMGASPRPIPLRYCLEESPPARGRVFIGAARGVRPRRIPTRAGQGLTGRR